MSDETLTLTVPHHGKLGIIHCGVTHEGLVVVAGDQKEIADGEEVVFERTGIKVKRNGAEYTFAKVA